MVDDEIEQRKSQDLKLYLNIKRPDEDKDRHRHRHGAGNVRWRSIPFTHPSKFDTIAMEDKETLNYWEETINAAHIFTWKRKGGRGPTTLQYQPPVDDI
ncbi:hypothetical protein FH972_026903 [Carpinus fangiana]|uniref:Uncharacterized protein n=1 Tax=Carpinus fangiana TaxID=176857 RepID=A0A5N6L5D3_9ROSI|nr:hypothetical protein FH972_026903 [Carpinus fangiana]